MQINNFHICYSFLCSFILTFLCGVCSNLYNMISEEFLETWIFINTSQDSFFNEETIELISRLGILFTSLFIHCFVLKRKHLIILNYYIYFVGISLLLCSTNIIMYYYSRFLLGLSVGITLSVVPLYICQISNTKNHKIILSLNFTFFYLGIAISGMLGTISNIDTTLFFLYFLVGLIALFLVMSALILDLDAMILEKCLFFKSLLTNYKARKSLFLLLFMNLCARLTGVEYLLYRFKIEFKEHGYQCSAVIWILPFVCTLFLLLLLIYVHKKHILRLSSIVILISNILLIFEIYEQINYCLIYFFHYIGIDTLIWLISEELIPLRYSEPTMILSLSTRTLISMISFYIFYTYTTLSSEIVHLCYSIILIFFTITIFFLYKEKKPSQMFFSSESLLTYK